MRVILCFFSIWLLLLTGFPCPDAACHAQATPSAESSDAHTGDDHKAPCSPFCHCATCPGFAMPRPFSYIQRAITAGVSNTQRHFNYQAPGQFDIANSIWQPPKL